MIMKNRIIAFLAAASVILCIFSAFTAYAEESTRQTPLSNVPYLESIEFENAVIDGGFVAGKTVFSMTLVNPEESPRLSRYKINGNAKAFVTYNYDNLNRQTGVSVTLAFESGSVIYTFKYSNVRELSINSNTNLAALSCEYGEVQPAINENDTGYKLYIPSDLTTLNITPVTEDTNAYCYPASINMELNGNQEPELNFTVNASDGSTKMYEFKVHRIDKTVAEVEEEMEQPGFVSFAQGELFYQRPAFMIAFIASAAGIAVILLLIAVTRRITVNPCDSEEKPFYSSVE